MNPKRRIQLSLSFIKASILLFLVSMCFSCSSINKGSICYVHSPLLRNSEIEFIPKSQEDSLYLKINESLAVDNWEIIQNSDCSEEYTFTKKKVRVKRKTKIPQQNKFHIYHIDEMMSIISKDKDGKIRTDTLLYNWRVNKDWNVKYEIVDFRKKEKSILGFDCDYYKIIEHKITKSSETKFVYELYTAQNIKFPTELSCGFFERIINKCPLEITITDMNCPKYYSKIIATHFSKNSSKAEFILPVNFK